MVFEWSERKRMENLRKHGYDFADCASLFNGPLYTSPDSRFDYGELRFRAFGLLDGCVIAVAYAESGGAVRLITMREASKYEEAAFFENIQN